MYSEKAAIKNFETKTNLYINFKIHLNNNNNIAIVF